LALDSLLAVQVSAAARYDQTAAEAPASVTVVTAEEIRAFGWRTLADVLAGVRGFYTSDDRNYTYIGVRGFGRPTDYNNRMLLLLDGYPVNDAFYGAAPAGLDLGVDLRTLDRIEIVRGPGSALYGSNAMLGVINLVTRDAAHGAHAIARAGVGSLRHYAGAAEAADSWDAADLWVSVGRERSGGEDLYFSELDDFSKGMDGEEATYARARLAWKDLTIRGRVSRRWKTIPTGPWGISLDDPRARTLDAWSDAGLAWTPELDATRQLEIQASLNRYRYEGYYPDDEGGLSDDENDVRTGRLAGQLLWDLRAEDRLMLAGEWRHHGRAFYRAADGTADYFKGDFPYDEWSLVAQDEHHVTPGLVVTGGVRYDHSGLGFGRPTFRGAAVWTPSVANTVKVLYGEAFRTPNVYERHYEDTFGPFLANASIQPELARTLELVWERRLGGPLWVTGAVFDTQIQGLIDTVEEEDGTTFFTNRDRMNATGMEAELQGRWGEGRLLRLSYGWTHARIEGLGEPSNSPAHILRGAFATPLVGRIAVASELRYESDRLTLRDTRTDPALLVDLRFTADELFAGLGAWAGVVNLLDTDYALPGGYEHVQSVIPQAGRRFELGVEYRY
jgi:iron complex outermembrane receptor protein